MESIPDTLMSYRIYYSERNSPFLQFCNTKTTFNHTTSGKNRNVQVMR